MQVHQIYIFFFNSALSTSKVNDIVSSHPHLMGKTLKIEDLQASADFLIGKNFNQHDLLQRPLTLLTSRITLENRTKVLNECCFKDIQLLFLCRFVSVINREIKILKAFGYIDHEKNVLENLLRVLDTPIIINKDISDDITLNSLREIVMNQYLKVSNIVCD